MDLGALHAEQVTTGWATGMGYRDGPRGLRVDRMAVMTILAIFIDILHILSRFCLQCMVKLYK